jgi:hypothetical protein
MREFLDVPLVDDTDMRSFDCIVVRVANDDFAQDDRGRIIAAVQTIYISDDPIPNLYRRPHPIHFPF